MHNYIRGHYQNSTMPGRSHTLYPINEWREIIDPKTNYSCFRAHEIEQKRYKIYLRLTIIGLNKVVKIAKADGNVGALKGEG